VYDTIKTQQKYISLLTFYETNKTAKAVSVTGIPSRNCEAISGIEQKFT